MKLRLLTMLALASAMLTACESSDPTDNPNDFPTKGTPKGAYLLCAGNYDQNNSTLDFFNPTYPDELVTKVFESTNNRALGSNANDMTIHGSKMYIVVNTSATLEITDLWGKSVKTINFATETGTPETPRFVTAAGSNVYVSLYEGYVAVVDTASLQITKRIAVGPNPEQLCAIGRKLYVAESGGYQPGYNNTVGIIDLDTETVTGSITTVVNPNRVAADSNGNLYVLSFGNYYDVQNTLVRYNLADNAAADTIATNSMILFTVAGNSVYVYSAKQENWVVTEKSISTCPTTFGDNNLTPFLADNDTPADVYSLSADPSNGDLYVGMTDYTTYGSFAVYGTDAKRKASHSLSSINPQGAWFVK